jgi:3-dehydroquinate dehydratase / shikimate dehydrogenase
MELPTLKTQRLILRPWKESDLQPFAEMNADLKVMEFYASPLTKEESDALAKKIQQDYVHRNYGFWAVEVPGIAPFIGYVGLNYWDLEMSFAPCVDIGWRIASSQWGYGFATEGAQEALRYGFEVLDLPEIFSMATIGNVRSHRVMEKLGMTYAENFYHPKLPKEHPLSMRVLYRLSQKEWKILQEHH